MPYNCRKSCAPLFSPKVIYPQTKKADGMSWALRFVVISCVWVTFSTAAYAYIDPGTGSLLLQAAIASVLTVGAAIRFHSQRVKEFIKALARRLRR